MRKRKQAGWSDEEIVTGKDRNRRKGNILWYRPWPKNEAKVWEDRYHRERIREGETVQLPFEFYLDQLRQRVARLRWRRDRLRNDIEDEAWLITGEDEEDVHDEQR